MKLCALFLIAFATVCSAQHAPVNKLQLAAIRVFGKACVARSGSTDAAVLKAGAGDYNTDQNTKCFFNCYLEKLDFLKNGVVQVKGFRNNLTPIIGEASVNEIDAKCNKIKGVDNCDTAFLLYQCYVAVNPATVLLYDGKWF